MAGTIALLFHRTSWPAGVKLGLIPGAAGTQRFRGSPASQKPSKCVRAATRQSGGCAEIRHRRPPHRRRSPRRSDCVCLRGRRKAAPPRRVSAMKSSETWPTTCGSFRPRRETAAKKQRGLLAPLAPSVRGSRYEMHSKKACKVEQRLFIDCLFSQQSKSLIHVFFSEREVSKIPDIPKELPSFLLGLPRLSVQVPWVVASPWCSPMQVFPCF